MSTWTFDVRRWPSRWRKAFVLALPITGLLWLTGAVLYGIFVFAFAIVAFFVCLPIAFMRSVWDGEDFETGVALAEDALKERLHHDDRSEGHA